MSRLDVSNTSDIKSLLYHKQLAKGQKDDGRRETMTRRTINKQENFKMLFVCMFVWLLP